MDDKHLAPGWKRLLRNQEVINRAVIKAGWKKWGKPKPSSNGSIYQCYRKGNHYLWVGQANVERSDDCISHCFYKSTGEALQMIRRKPFNPPQTLKIGVYNES